MADEISGPGRVATGICGLDTAIKGGLLEGRTYLLSGGPGAGKSIFALQFLWTGLQAGKSCVYVAINERPEDLMATAKLLGWDFSAACADKKLNFLDASPYLAGRQEAGRVRYRHHDIRKLVADLAKHVKSNEADLLVIDPVNAILDNAREADTLAFSREFVFSCETHLGCTTLLTLDKRGSLTDENHPLEFLVSGIFNLGAARRNGSCKRTLVVKKSRCTAASLSIHTFEIRPVKGIFLTSGGSRVANLNNQDHEEELYEAGRLRVAGE